MNNKKLFLVKPRYKAEEEYIKNGKLNFKEITPEEFDFIIKAIKNCGFYLYDYYKTENLLKKLSEVK